MHETPKIPHLNQDGFNGVYPPSEDTYILLDALESDEYEIRSLNPCMFLEIGTGSGCVSTFLASLLRDLDCLYFLTDIDSAACVAASKTANLNDVIVDIVNCDLCGPLEKRLTSSIDVCVFNPPYVPTSNADISTEGVYAACNGGIGGRFVINRVLEKMGQLLTENGLFYLVCIGENNPEEIRLDALRLGLNCEIFLKRQAGIEMLYVLKMTRIIKNNRTGKAGPPLPRGY